MKTMLKRLSTTICGFLLTVQPVIGQVYTKPEATSSGSDSTWLEWLIGSAFMIGCLFVAFKSSKRANLE